MGHAKSIIKLHGVNKHIKEKGTHPHICMVAFSSSRYDQQDKCISDRAQSDVMIIVT